MILDSFPEFAQSAEWKEHLDFWQGKSPGLCTDISIFGHFILHEFNKPHSIVDFIQVFNFIEFLMVEGNQEVQDAAATCFLENLINYTSSSSNYLDPNKFVHLLGPESKEYCKAWDGFTGVKTDGLYD